MWAELQAVVALLATQTILSTRQEWTSYTTESSYDKLNPIEQFHHCSLSF